MRVREINTNEIFLHGRRGGRPYTKQYKSNNAVIAGLTRNPAGMLKR